MLKCDNGCNRMYQEYYWMPDNRILCVDCWRREFEKSRQADQIKQNIDKIEKHICWLNHKISDEKNRSPLDDSLLVKIMKRDLESLLHKRSLETERILNIFRHPSPCYPTPPHPQHFRAAKWINSENAPYFEQITFPNTTKTISDKKKAEEEQARKIREEQERIKAEIEQKRQEELERNAEATALIKSIRTEYDVTFRKKFGMKIMVDFEVNYLRNKKGQIAAYFWLQKNNGSSKLMDCNKKYCAPDGQVSVAYNFRPSLIQYEYKNITLFMPYDELHLPKGIHNLQFSLEIFDNTWRSIALSSFQNFHAKMQKKSPLKVHKANKTTKGGCLRKMAIFALTVIIGISIFIFAGILLGL